ncbi:putative U-box domain-containing protein 50 isoform X2 [Macadamia integrifolia]|nr:putative U-box domain-containing protein 50 isoform X2 [Macadamia integrifolia]XP_042508957.1 putative U-box domain-containing protein 50 isoform X2 [Macadamia integrifolia]XP_042508958.1 putative U-box domain-containing protein 50 isoform X2 [Macadamia integrifolia]
MEKTEEPIQKAIVGLISSHQVTKLVMGITLVKQSSWKTKGAISGSFYIHRHEPSFCELYIICGGKLVFLREENDEEYMEDERGVMVAKMKEKGGSVKSWFGKMFIDSAANHEPHALGRSYHHRSAPPTSAAMDTESVSSPDWWEDYAPEVESYFQCLPSSNLIEKEDTKQSNPTKTAKLKLEHIVNGDFTGASSRIETLKAKIQEVQKFIEERKEEAKGYVERQLRAASVITLCNRRAVELEGRISGEINNKTDLKNKLEAAREHIYEVSRDIEESKSRLRSILELQSELATKLQSTSLSKSHVEAQLENATATRTEILREMEELRRQRDLLLKRIEFCRQREAIAAAAASAAPTSSSGRDDHLDFSYREFVADEIREATDNFSEQVKLKRRDDQTNSYRGMFNHMAIAIELQASVAALSQEEFRDKVELLSQIRHPKLVNMIGACHELRCIVFEYMHNGSLHDLLFFTQRNPNSNHHYKRNPKRLPWHVRIRIAADVSLGLGFLHLAQPRPIIHGELNLSNVLLDSNLVAKITTSKLSHCSEELQMRSDIYAFGVLMLQLLTGREGDGLVEEVRRAMEGGTLNGILDAMAGEWPLDLTMEYARIAMRCVCINGNMELTTTMVMKEVEEVRRKAVELMEMEGFDMAVEGSGHRDHGDIPCIFLCPILQEVMINPHVAADGFSYELGAIAEWLGTGHETSPMTNLRLDHKLLTPNHTLRSLIQEWLNN